MCRKAWGFDSPPEHQYGFLSRQRLAFHPETIHTYAIVALIFLRFTLGR